jgi:pyridoxal phosphate enzyme (YggS family)
MAVSKVHPVESLLEAYAAGQRLFGENRVQEFAGKFPSLSACTEGEYHLIGPLQSNKSSKAAELFHSIDTVDSVKLAQRLDSAVAALNKKLPIYIEVKLSHEESKHGISPEELPALLNAIAPLENLTAVGLMTSATPSSASTPPLPGSPPACPTTSPSLSRRAAPASASAPQSLAAEFHPINKPEGRSPPAWPPGSS